MAKCWLRLTTVVSSIILLAVFALPCRGEDFIAGYHLEGKSLILGETLQGPDGGLKPFAQLSPSEIATIYHEMWHAYFIECQTKEKGVMYRRFGKEVDAKYPSIPAAKRMEVHEEAVADFIDAVIGTTVQIRRFLDKHAPEERAGIMGRSRFPAIYKSLFADSYTGYYTRSVKGADGADLGTSAGVSGASAVFAPFALDPKKALAPFIASAREAKLPVGYLVAASNRIRGVVFINAMGLPVPVKDAALASRPESWKTAALPSPTPQAAPKSGAAGSSPAERGLLALLDLGTRPPRGGGPQADVVMSTVPLDRKDMQLVERDLFEGLLPEDPHIVFQP